MARHQNEKAKRRYFDWLRGAKGYAESTIDAIERAVHMFEESTGHKCFKTFSERQASGFKAWMETGSKRGKSVSKTTMYGTLRHVNSFFSWLATQSGYKSKISLDAVSYLTLDRRSVREVLSPRPKRFPSLDQVRQLVQSIDVRNEIDQRDRAVIAFMMLTGIRYEALCTLSLACLDIERLVVQQEPRLGVHTKGGKAITTWLLPMDRSFVEIVKEWIKFLRTTKRFGPTDPLFPRTKVVQGGENLGFRADGVEPQFWRGGDSVREILRDRFQAAGLPYFSPHSFRHAACQVALMWARTPEEFKALSQNFGHEHVLTTLRTYGTLPLDRVAEVISRMTFEEKKESQNGTVSVDDIIRFAEAHKK